MRLITTHTNYFCMIQGWGAPTALAQFAHLSSAWASVEVYWVDQRGDLVFRKALRIGDRHTELTSADHVWFLNAVATDDVDRSEQHGVVIQPCSTALRKSKMTTLVWIPRKSLTMSQRDVVATIPSHKMKTLSDDDAIETLPPVLQVQLL